MDFNYMGYLVESGLFSSFLLGDSTESSDKRANLLAKQTGPPAPTEREVAGGVVFGPADSAEERAANEA
ncbi:hypothetical protein E2C01_073456 [Portunus trituberculatus]|uniref:Uncharacterized protein n=1 Tax=Portunus trituberculatus TaxID=210409 RepID=A0A5B7IBR2_PORTR|nr:hypothetical protein [Portunus trituberculatus]